MVYLAEDVTDVLGKITPPPQAAPFTRGNGAQGLSIFMTNLIELLFAVSTVIVIFMLIISAFQWIISGGDKDAIAKARARILHTLIGLALLATTFFFLNIIGGLLHFQFFVGQGVPGFFCAPNCAPY